MDLRLQAKQVFIIWFSYLLLASCTWKKGESTKAASNSSVESGSTSLTDELVTQISQCFSSIDHFSTLADLAGLLLYLPKNTPSPQMRDILDSELFSKGPKTLFLPLEPPHQYALLRNGSATAFEIPADAFKALPEGQNPFPGPFEYRDAPPPDQIAEGKVAMVIVELSNEQKVGEINELKIISYVFDGFPPHMKLTLFPSDAFRVTPSIGFRPLTDLKTLKSISTTLLLEKFLYFKERVEISKKAPQPERELAQHLEVVKEACGDLIPENDHSSLERVFREKGILEG